ncbi:MAG: NUDIX domain-containing protein [Candidatus Magasanikbacteria bacterium]|nr:NUDIX domain-containing protein [Candidatus Magasanikbacteria bacterium]
MHPRHTATPVVYLLLEQDKKTVFIRRCNTGYQDGNYDLPAGHMESGEVPTQSMVREAKEEIGITVLESDLELVHVLYRTKHDATGDRVDFFFRCRSWQGDVVNTEPDTCDDLAWFNRTALPENMTPHVRYVIDKIEKNIFFSELDVDFFQAAGLFDATK